MKFKTTEDVDAPPDLTFARLTDFGGIEAELARHGAALARVGNWQAPEAGRGWRGTVRVRGQVRPASSEIVDWTAPTLCTIRSTVGGMDAVFEVSLAPLRPDLTRVQAVLELSARTLSARLALQTLKLGRARVLQRLQGYLARQGNLAEEDWRRARG